MISIRKQIDLIKIYKNSLENTYSNIINFRLLNSDKMHKHMLYIAIESLLNANGGYLILDENITNIKETKKYIKNEIDKLSVLSTIKIKDIKYNDKNIIIIIIPNISIEEKPVCYSMYQTSKHYYIYRNNKIVSMEYEEIECINAINGKNVAETSEIFHIRESYINDNDVKKFIARIKEKHQSLSKLTDAQIMALYKIRNRYSHRSLLYLMFFSYHPQVQLTNLVIIINNKITKTKKIIDGPIIHQYRQAIIELKKDLNYKLLLNKDNKLVNRTKYLFSIIQEAVYNALVHRDYSYLKKNIPIEISIKENELEIKSPGYYYSEEDNPLDSKLKYSRNINMKMVMDLMTEEDKISHGFKHIKLISKMHNIKLPSIKMEDGYFIMTIYPEATKTIYQEPYTITNILTFCVEPKSKLEIYHHFFNDKNDDYKYFNKKYLEPLINLKVLQLTIPDKPTSKYQKLKTKEDLIDNLSNMDVIN